MYNTKEGKTCVIYIRVSSERQVKGYSLDGQKHYLAECAERRGMTVLDTYVEEGKSGKSIEGRTEFQRMLDDIQSGKVHTDYVLVFKLSRFGRNARDVLNSLEFIMKYGVHLMCVEDGLDSSTSMGKMMITILGAVAELERENIIAQSLLGREEKAKSGGWNGGFAPYGYRLVKGDDKSKGKLETVPEEKAVVQLVFDMFLNRNMGYTAISGYLNRNGYTRPPAKNAIRPSYGEWSSDHIKRMLSNPVYTGRVAWGKRRTEKVPGSDNEYRLVKQDEYILSEVISHEEFVSKEDFDRVQEIKAIRGKKGNHNIGQYNAHLLSGIVKCPQCGAPMKGLQKGFVPKRCANCGRWFLQMPGMTYAYCGEPAPGQDGKTCREIGATSSFRSKVQNNDVWKAHQRAYKKYFARTRKGTMSKGVFEVWSRKMEMLRDDALMEYDRAKSEEERQRIVDEVTQKLNKL